MFWDSSALIPLILPEARSASLTEQLASGQEITVWWSTPVECLSAIYRRHRETPIANTVLSAALGRLRALVEDATRWPQATTSEGGLAGYWRYTPSGRGTPCSSRQPLPGARNSLAASASSRWMTGSAKPRVVRASPSSHSGLSATAQPKRVSR